MNIDRASVDVARAAPVVERDPAARPVPASLAAGDAATSGAILFARYAYPPNELGYCGPEDSAGLLQYGASRVTDPGLALLARGFAGAWPYLELIAAVTGTRDPLDRRVVEAYWLGSPLLDGIDMATFAESLRERFRHRAGKSWGNLAEAIPEGAVPNHSFHVFGVYPWVGLLDGQKGDSEPLTVLDRCRIRWGQVIATRGEEVDVLSRPLTYDGHDVGLGAPRAETARAARSGLAMVGFRPGDWVSLHWGWVCDRLERRQLVNLRRGTLRQLAITNRRVVHSGPAAAIG